ncbi:MAG: ABC transporter permease, partial [Holosporales bacterium]|nr:ABC transporter permease [Holosporales bacterium]
MERAREEPQRKPLQDRESFLIAKADTIHEDNLALVQRLPPFSSFFYKLFPEISTRRRCSFFAKNQMQSVQRTLFVFLPSMMLSGFMFPFYGMPLWAQAIGGCVPMTYFLRLVKGLLLKGSAFSELWPNFWPLIVFALVIGTVAVRLYRKT